MADPSPEQNDRRPRRTGLRRDAVSLLTGLALGAAALLLSKPAHADAVAIGLNGASTAQAVERPRGVGAIVETRYATA